MPTVADPLQVPLRLTRAPQAIDARLVCAQPSMLGAIKLCITVAGFERDKQICGVLGIDAGHWSRILRGEAHFPVDKLPELMALCGNEAPLIWLAHTQGYDPASLRRRESETEKENRELRERLAALENEREIERRYAREVLAR